MSEIGGSIRWRVGYADGGFSNGKTEVKDLLFVLVRNVRQTGTIGIAGQVVYSSVEYAGIKSGSLFGTAVES